MPARTIMKLSQHVTTRNKIVPCRRTGESSPAFPRKVVRIIVTDPYATDSSDDDDGEQKNVRRRVKRHIQEIHFYHVPKPASAKPKRVTTSECGVIRRTTKDNGARRRPWERSAAEIRDLNQSNWVLPRTYDTPGEAATVDNRAIVQRNGDNAVNDFPNFAVTETANGLTAMSPTSVLHYEYLTPDDDAFPFDIEVPLNLPSLKTTSDDFDDALTWTTSL